MSRASIAAVFISLLFSVFLKAQDDVPVPPATQTPYSFSEHLVYAGNMGLNFGNVTSIGISPMVGYKVTPRFIPGVGATYNYIRIHYFGYQSQTAHIYGGSLWARYYFLENVFANGEYEVLNGEWDPYFTPGIRYNLTSLLLGGGYCESFGSLSSYVLVLYNVTQSYDSPYSSPLVIKVGMGFGF